MTAASKIIGADQVQAAVDAVMGLDISQAPTEPKELAERLTAPQAGVTEALTLLFSQKQTRTASRAAPLVYAAIEAANRAYPEEMKAEIKSKPFVTAIASSAGEAMALAKSPGLTDGGTYERQPELVKLAMRFLALTPSDPKQQPMGKLSIEDRAGIYALALGSIRAIDKHLQGPEKPVQSAQEPGRNDPCHCGSGKKYKKCHGGPNAPAA